MAEVKSPKESAEAEVKLTPNSWWIPTSPELLAQAEARILKKLKSPYKTYAVNIGPVVGDEDCEIWTLSMNEHLRSETNEKIPLVLLHGFAAGLAFWTLNFDCLGADRPVYAIDHLGFGRSSRPKFSSNAEKAEGEFVLAIEEWRKKVGLEKIVLAGHSFGGYLAFSYALAHPTRVAHLILADPWGFPPPPPPTEPLPCWVRVLLFLGIIQPKGPFWTLRMVGPKGPQLLQWARRDLIKKFEDLNKDGGDVRFGDYMYHCSAQTMSGVTAFSNMIEGLGRAKRPMVYRIQDLDPEIPVTCIRGSVSPIRGISQQVWEQERGGKGDVHFHMMEGAGHHIYSDDKDTFHEIIIGVCSSLDKTPSES